jgi:hypothetical protein
MTLVSNIHPAWRKLCQSIQYSTEAAVAGTLHVAKEAPKSWGATLLADLLQSPRDADCSRDYPRTARHSGTVLVVQNYNDGYMQSVPKIECKQYFGLEQRRLHQPQLVDTVSSPTVQ